MSVLTELQTTVATQRRALDALEPGCLSGEDALALLAVVTEGERVLAAGRTALAKRVEDSNVWRASGEPSAAHFLANQTGTTRGARAGGAGDGRAPGAAPGHGRGVPGREAFRDPGRGGGRCRGAQPAPGAAPAGAGRALDPQAAARRVPAGEDRGARRAGGLRGDQAGALAAHLDRRRRRVLRGVPHHARCRGADARRARRRDRGGVQGGKESEPARAPSGLRHGRAGVTGVLGRRWEAGEADHRDRGAGRPRGDAAGPHPGGRGV